MKSLAYNGVEWSIEQMSSATLITVPDIEALLSEALLIGIAAGAGFATSKPSVDRDSMDMLVHGGGDMCPMIGVQLKASINLVAKSGIIKFKLPVKNYNDLRQKTMVPRMLVLLRLPRGKANWIAASPRLLSIRHCAYWLSLEGAKSTLNTTNVTVEVPTKNLLTVSSLENLMVRARTGSLL